MKSKNIIIIIISVVIACGFGLLVSIKLTSNKNNNPQINNETTNNNQQHNNSSNTNNDKIKVDYSTEEKEDIMVIDGFEKTIKIKTYISSINLKVNYEHDRYMPKKINDNSFIIESISNPSIYIKFELLNKTDYDNYYNIHKDKNYIIEDEYIIHYRFTNEQDNYYMITIHNINNLDYIKEHGNRLGYIFSSRQTID